MIDRKQKDPSKGLIYKRKQKDLNKQKTDERKLSKTIRKAFIKGNLWLMI